MKNLFLLLFVALLLLSPAPVFAQDEPAPDDTWTEDTAPVHPPAFHEKQPPVPVAAPQDGQPWYVGHAQEEYLNQLDPMVDSAMKGYNAEDHKVFFADYCKAMAGVATEMTFKNMVLGMFKKKTGDFKHKKLLDSRCSFNETNPLLYYEAEFANGKFLLPVNFSKEGEGYKVMQIQVQDLQP